MPPRTTVARCAFGMVMPWYRRLAVDVVVVGHRGAAGEFEDVLAVRGDPVPVVGVRPRHRALGLHLLGDLLELQPVLRRVPVEVVAVLLAVAVGGAI